MSRGWMGAAVALAMVVGVMASVQQAVQAGPAVVIKSDGVCGMPGADTDGNFIFGGLGVVTTLLENDNKVMIKCKGEGLTNESGQAQSFEGFSCGIQPPSGGDFITADESHATISASGAATMTCAYKK